MQLNKLLKQFNKPSKVNINLRNAKAKAKQQIVAVPQWEELNTKGVAEDSNFKPIESYISQTAQERR